MEIGTLIKVTRGAVYLLSKMPNETGSGGQSAALWRQSRQLFLSGERPVQSPPNRSLSSGDAGKQALDELPLLTANCFAKCPHQAKEVL